MDEHRRSKILFLAVTFLFWIALYLYVPTLPLYLKARATNLSTVGLVLSMYGLWMAFARLPMGIISDALGHSKLLIALGLSSTVIGTVIMGLGKNIPVLAAGRAFTGLSAATWVLLIAVFSTFFDADKAIFSSSMLSFAANFGRLLATASTGFLNRVGGYSLAFYLAGVLGVVAIVMVLFVREVRLPPMQVSLRSVGELFLRRDVMMPTVFSVLVHYADWSVTFGFLPVLAQEMGMGDVFKSLLISLNIAGIVVANLLNTLLVRKIGHRKLLTTGALLMFAGIVVIAYSPVRAFLFIGTVSMGFAFGMVYPILMGMSIQQVERTKRSTAMGIHQSVYAIGMFTGPWLAGNIADRFGIRSSFYITACIYLVLVLTMLLFLFRRGWSKAHA